MIRSLLPGVKKVDIDLELNTVKDVQTMHVSDYNKKDLRGSEMNIFYS